MDISKKRKADENGAAFPQTLTDPIPTQPPPPALTVEDADKILEPFTKDQLHTILRTALIHNPEILSSVRSIADSNSSLRKLFTRGLGWETTTDKLRSTFSLFGDIEEAIVITDKNTGKSKGYGFVTFRHVDGAILALKEPNKKIDGRITVTQLAVAGNLGNSTSVDVSMRKIYVGNVPFEISSERLLGHFSAYGEIEEGPLGFDKQTGKPKGFAFFVYKTEDGARASLVDPVKSVDGYQVICKLATDNKKGRVLGQGQGQGQSSMGSTGVAGEVISGPGSMQVGVGSNYGVVPGGGGVGLGNYGGFSGGPGLGHQNPHLNSGIGGPGGPGYGNQGPVGSGSFTAAAAGGSGYGGGAGGGYGTGGGYGSGGAGGGYGSGGSQYGGGVGGTGEYGGGFNNAGGYRMPQNSVGLPSSGGYPDGGNYGLSSSAYPTQMHQPPPGGPPRVQPGGMYQGMPPPYY